MEEQSTNLFEHHLKIRPRSLTVKIERAAREHPCYWETWLLLVGKGYDVYDKVVFSPKDNDGYLIYVCIKDNKICYHVLHFKYTDPSIYYFVSVSYTTPYLAETLETLVLQKPTTERVETESDYIPPKMEI